MTIFKICTLAVFGVVIAILVKQWKSDILPLLRLSLFLFLTFACIKIAFPLLDFLKELAVQNEISEYIDVLFKALGIGVLTQIASNICRECGESGIGEGVEFAGKIEILLLCIPLMKEIISEAGALLALGGG